MNEKMIKVLKGGAIVVPVILLGIYNRRQRVKHDMLMAEIAIENHKVVKKAVEVIMVHDDVLRKHDEKLAKTDMDLRTHLMIHEVSKKKKA